MVDLYKATWATLVYISVPFFIVTLLISEVLDIVFHLLTFGIFHNISVYQPVYEKGCQVAAIEDSFQEKYSEESECPESHYIFKTPERRSPEKVSVQNFVKNQDAYSYGMILRPNPLITPRTRKRKRSPQTLPTIYESDADFVSQTTRRRSLSLFTSTNSTPPSKFDSLKSKATRQIEFPLYREEGGAFHAPNFTTFISGSCSVVGDDEDGEIGGNRNSSSDSIQVTSNVQKKTRRERGYTI